MALTESLLSGAAPWGAVLSFHTWLVKTVEDERDKAYRRLNGWYQADSPNWLSKDRLDLKLAESRQRVNRQAAICYGSYLASTLLLVTGFVAIALASESLSLQETLVVVLLIFFPMLVSLIYAIGARNDLRVAARGYAEVEWKKPT